MALAIGNNVVSDSGIQLAVVGAGGVGAQMVVPAPPAR